MPPRRHAPADKWASQHSTPPSARPRLTQDNLKKLAAKMRDAYKWPNDPHNFQIDGVRAQIEGVDAIIQAPTGAGKTAIAAGPHLWPGNEGKTTIMVSPLLALQNEMVNSFKNDYGLDAIAVQGKNGSCSKAVVQAILSRKYRVVLVSPEMLQSRPFVNRILRNSRFMHHVISLFVDEAHCISHWGADFRKKYGSLGMARAFLTCGTPVIAVTATLTPRVRRDIHSKLHFPKQGSRFFNVGNDRPNVSIVVRATEHPLNTMEDLDFVIPATVHQVSDIPKTYLYVDDITAGSNIIDFLQQRLESRSGGAVSAGVIRPFNATMSDEYREAAMEQFRAGTIRIMVCTDAAGMGCNIADIDLVVQWKLPATLSNFIQRAGRAGRGRNRSGLAVLIVERSAYSIDLTKDSTTTAGPKSRSKKAATDPNTKPSKRKNAQEAKDASDYALSHGLGRGGTACHDDVPRGVQPSLNPEALDEGLLMFVQSVQCRRKVWAKAFEAEEYIQGLEPGVACCDICAKLLLDRTRPGSIQMRETRKTKAPTQGQVDLHAQNKLEEWRESVFSRDHPLAQFDSAAILDDDTITRLSSIGPVNLVSLTALLEPTWMWWDKYGEELIAFINTLDITFIPQPKKDTKNKRTADSLQYSSKPPSPKRTCIIKSPAAAQSTDMVRSSQIVSSDSPAVPWNVDRDMHGATLRGLAFGPPIHHEVHSSYRSAQRHPHNISSAFSSTHSYPQQPYMHPAPPHQSQHTVHAAGSSTAGYHHVYDDHGGLLVQAHTYSPLPYYHNSAWTDPSMVLDTSQQQTAMSYSSHPHTSGQFHNQYGPPAVPAPDMFASTLYYDSHSIAPPPPGLHAPVHGPFNVCAPPGPFEDFTEGYTYAEVRTSPEMLDYLHVQQGLHGWQPAPQR